MEEELFLLVTDEVSLRFSSSQLIWLRVDDFLELALLLDRFFLWYFFRKFHSSSLN